MEENGKEKVIWKLSKQQVDYIENSLGYYVEKTLYYVHTKNFPEWIRKKYPILNDLHYAKRKGKSYMTRKLSPQEKQLLREHGVSFSAFKYTIYLQRH
jgi:hypothetical protein